MTNMTTFNENRTARTQARLNELLDLVRENNELTTTEILDTLANRWGKSTDTVKPIMQYAKRKRLIAQRMVWSVK